MVEGLDPRDDVHTAAITDRLQHFHNFISLCGAILHNLDELFHYDLRNESFFCELVDGFHKFEEQLKWELSLSSEVAYAKSREGEGGVWDGDRANAYPVSELWEASC